MIFFTTKNINNNVLLVKIPSIIIYLLKGFLQTPLFSSTNQWEKDVYEYQDIQENVEEYSSVSIRLFGHGLKLESFGYE